MGSNTTAPLPAGTPLTATQSPDPSIARQVTSIDFSQIVDEHYKPLYRFALSLSRDAHNAADLTQQAFYIFAEKGHQLRERSKAKSWLFTTLHREFLKQRRRGARMTVVEDTEPLMEPPLFAEANENARKLDGAAVVDALDQLDELYRAPLTLFYLKQVSYKEIAEILDIPIGTVMSRLSRGKSQLRKIIAAADSPPAGRVIPFVKENLDTAAAPQPKTSSST